MADLVKVLFQLQTQGDQVQAELNKVAGAYKKVSSEVDTQNKEVKALLDQEAKLIALRNKTQNPSVVVQYNKHISDTRKKIDELTKAEKDNTKALNENAKQASVLNKNLDKAFDTTKAKSLRTQLKDLKAQLAATDDDEEFLNLSIQAGKLQDKIEDAGNAAKIFASDSKFEVIGNSIGNIGSKLLALDFDGAAQGSQLLLRASQQITFKDALIGIKQMGQTLFNIGKALLTNPLFLIGAAVALIVINFEKLKNSGGAIGSVFKFIGAIIDGITDSFFELTDAIGLTDKAASESAARVQKYYEVLAESVEKNADRIIKLQKAQGKETVQAEINKNVQLSALNELAYNAYRDNLIRQGKTLDTLSEEELEKIKEFGDKKADLNTEFAVILAEKEQKESKDRLERFKKAEEERLALAKKLRDLEAANIVDEVERAKAQAVIKYNDEFILAKGNKDLIFELRKQLDAELAKIDKDAADRQQQLIDKQLQEAEVAALKEVEIDLNKKKKILANTEAALDEEQRHQTALLSLKLEGQQDSQVLLLANEIAFEEIRLQQTLENYGKESDEFKKQKNKVEELQARHIKELNKLDKQRLLAVLDNTKKITDAALDAANKIIAAELKRVDAQISAQQKRVDEVARIAENGNAQLLELEKERLDKLTAEKEKFVRAQQALAVVELVANTAIAISKAAAEGGAGAAFTIAAALIALVAGLASARSIAGQAAFYDGGLYDGQGFTGNGNPRGESKAVGSKPYVYHNEEFIFNHGTTRKFRPIFEDVHSGKIDLNQMKAQSEMYNILKMRGISTSGDLSMIPVNSGGHEIEKLKTSMKEVVDAIKAQPGMEVHINEKGIFVITHKYYKNQKRIDSIAR